MSVLYDTLVGSANAEVFVTSTSTLGYPASNLYNVFGPVYLPRVYGKDLSAFELASSGKISVTLSDTYVFDLERNAAIQTTLFSAVPGESLQFLLGSDSNDVSITFDASSNNLALTASNDLIFTANAIVYNVTESAASVSGGDNMMGASGALNLYGSSNASLASLSNSVAITSAGSNVYVVLESTGCNLNQYARNTIQMSASNSFLFDAKNNFVATADKGSMYLSANHSNMSLTFAASNAALYALSNVSITSSNAFVARTIGSSFSLSNYTASFVTSSNITTVSAKNSVTASNFYDVFAASNLNLKAGSALSNVALSLASESNIGSASLRATSNIDINSSTLSVNALNTLSLSTSNSLLAISAATDNYIQLNPADSNIAVSSSSNLSLVATAGSLTANALQSIVVSSAASNVLVYAETGVDVNSASTVTVNSTVGPSWTQWDSNLTSWSAGTLSNIATVDIYSYAESNVLTIATKNLGLSATDGSFQVNAAESNVALVFAAFDQSATLVATGNATVWTGSNLAITADNSNVTLGFTSGTSTLYASSNILNITTNFSTVAADLVNFESAHTTFATQDFSLTGSNLVSLTAFDNSQTSIFHVTPSNIGVTTAQGLGITLSNTTVGGQFDYVTLNDGLVIGSTAGLVAIQGFSSGVTLNDLETSGIVVNEGISLTTSNDFLVGSTSNILTSVVTSFAASNFFSVYAAESNVTLGLGSNASAVLYAASNIVASATDIDINAMSTLSLSTSNAALYIGASNNSLQMSPLTSTVSLSAHSNIALTANFGNASISTLNAISMTSSTSNIAMTAASNILLTSGYGEIILATPSGVTLSNFQGDVSDLFTLSNGITATSASNVTLLSTIGLSTLNLDSNVTMTTDNTIITGSTNLLSFTTNLSMITASNFVGTATTGSLYLNASQSNVALAFAQSNYAATLFAKGGIDLESEAGLSFSNVLNGAGDEFVMNNGIKTLTYGPTTIAQVSGSKIGLSNNIHLESVATIFQTSLTNTVSATNAGSINVVSGPLSLTSTSSNNQILMKDTGISATAVGASLSLASATSIISGSGASYSYVAQSNVGYTFAVGNTSMLKVESGLVTVNGNLDILGTVNSISVNQTNLQVNDHTIDLCYPVSGDNSPVYDGVANTASGIHINGLPQNPTVTDLAHQADVYTKSLLWNFGGVNGGVDALLTHAGISNESYWELQGGRFQMTAHKTDGKLISFAFRINEYDELEFVKTWDDATNTRQMRRVAKFGRTIGL